MLASDGVANRIARPAEWWDVFRFGLFTSARSDLLLLPELVKQIGRPERALDIVSPYFVPGDGGTAMLTDLARRGVKVRVLTNSLAASDESVVHAGYMTRRRDLVRARVALWELKPTATKESLKVTGGFGSGKVAGLHAKTYAVDRARIFVGSFNFDQRSARLNTEMGLLSTEQFIELAASASSMTGRPYLVRCGSGVPVPNGTWLLSRLQTMRSAGQAKRAP